MIKAEVKNSLYIVSKIAKEANSISFVTSIKQVKLIIELDKITMFVAALSSIILLQSSTALLRSTKPALLPTALIKKSFKDASLIRQID